jgi:hypothetical protein
MWEHIIGIRKGLLITFTVWYQIYASFNNTGATSGARCANPSRAPEVDTGVKGVYQRGLLQAVNGRTDNIMAKRRMTPKNGPQNITYRQLKIYN